jgi:hypothetical protein
MHAQQQYRQHNRQHNGIYNLYYNYSLSIVTDRTSNEQHRREQYNQMRNTPRSRNDRDYHQRGW